MDLRPALLALTLSACSLSACSSSPPVQVANCGALPAAGTFEEITPPGVTNTFAIAADPINQGTLYVGTLQQKLWKTTDCGATWTQVATGANGADVDRGMNWTMAVDPQDSNIVYTNSGYGSNSFYRSENGGVDWEVSWPPPSQPELRQAFTYNFANVVAIDPSNRNHILLTFHEECLPPHPKTCIAESMDRGVTWRLVDGLPAWNGNEGQVIFFLDNGATWLWGSQTNGFWRTGNSGGSWEEIRGMTTSHLQGSQLVRTRAGGFFVAGADGIWRSPDGTAASWRVVPDTGPIVGGLVSDGTTLYASTCYFGNFCQKQRYLKSPESDGQTWAELPSPTLTMGGTFAYDAGHNLLYSSNGASGLWRVVVK